MTGAHPPATGRGGVPAAPASRVPSPPFGTVAIVGLGLMGGSLARALKGLPHPPRVTASSNSASDLEAAARAGAIDAASTNPAAILAGADLVVYATPLDVTLRLLPAHAPRWSAGARVSDVAGLKAPVAAAMARLGESARYTGSHPMAGREGSGFRHATPDLFADATVWLTGAQEGGAGVEVLWRSVGGHPRWTDAAAHDQHMAWCSHLPQLTANALARVLSDGGYTTGDLGTGGTGMVRLAGSSPAMWLPVLARSEAAPALRALARTAQEIAEAVEQHDLSAIEDWMQETRAWRNAGRAGAKKESTEQGERALP